MSQQDHNNFLLIPIDSIKIGRRFRRDLGDITSFAKEIQEIGLLHPVVINQKSELICGLRRIEAFKTLGRTEILAHVVNLEEIIKGEISENNKRKDFSWEEIIEIKKAIEPEIKKESEKRMLVGKPSAKFAEGTDNNPISKNHSDNQTRSKVAKYVSLHGKKVSHNTLKKGEIIYDYAQKQPALFGQIWSDLNSEKISAHKAYKKMQRLQRHQELLDERESMPPQFSDSIKLIEGDFVEQSMQIADNSVDLIFTDPPYNLESLPLYKELGNVAARVLKDDGSLVTYCIQDKKYEIQEFMISSGLTSRWELAVNLAGPFAKLYEKQVIVTWKPLLWFVKGNKLRTTGFIRDSVVSEPPTKRLHDWEQSITEANHVITELTLQGDVVLDCFMGIGTTGIAALNNKRRFIGIEKDNETFKIAMKRIGKANHQT